MHAVPHCLFDCPLNTAIRVQHSGLFQHEQGSICLFWSTTLIKCQVLLATCVACALLEQEAEEEGRRRVLRTSYAFGPLLMKCIKKKKQEELMEQEAEEEGRRRVLRTSYAFGPLLMKCIKKKKQEELMEQEAEEEGRRRVLRTSYAFGPLLMKCIKKKKQEELKQQRWSF